MRRARMSLTPPARVRACSRARSAAPVRASRPPQLALIFTAIVTMAEVSFVENPGCMDELFFVNRGVDVIFTFDMCLQFFLMYPQAPASATDTVRWVHDQDMITSHYLKTWFVLDFFSIATFAFDIMALKSPYGTCFGGDYPELGDNCAGNLGALKIMRVVRVARLVKLVRLVKGSKILQRFESRQAINYGHLALVKCLVNLILSAHCARARRRPRARRARDARAHAPLGRRPALTRPARPPPLARSQGLRAYGGCSRNSRTATTITHGTSRAATAPSTTSCWRRRSTRRPRSTRR